MAYADLENGPIKPITKHSAHTNMYITAKGQHISDLINVVKYDTGMMMMGVRYLHQPMRARALLPQASCFATDAL